tara:strand:- start:697 stop:900 length:204 start_codon:yes stop_codon:yes gene_type:complete
MEPRGPEVLEVLEELLRDMTVEVMVVLVVALTETRMVPVQGGMVVTVGLPRACMGVIVDRVVEGRVF